LGIREHYGKEIIYEVYHLVEKKKILEKERIAKEEKDQNYRSIRFKHSLNHENSRVNKMFNDRLSNKYHKISFFKVSLFCLVYNFGALLGFFDSRPRLSVSDKEFLFILSVCVFFSSYLIYNIHRWFQERSKGYRDLLRKQEDLLKRLEKTEAVLICSSCKQCLYLSKVNTTKLNCSNCKTLIDVDRDVAAGICY